MSVVIALLAAGAALVAAMALAWAVQRRTGNSGWIDVTWTLSLGAVAAVTALTCGTGPRAVLVAVFVGVWSLRLGLHLAARTSRASDDPRYRDLMEQWGAAAPRRLFWFAQSQAAVSLLLTAAILAAACNPTSFPGVGDVLALAVFITGLAGEAVADAQLRRFKADPANRGRICDRGLWAWSRHPNYFFEWVCWLSYPLLAIAPASGYAAGYAALVAPLCMYWLLAHVSGVPPLETHLMRTRGAAFAIYRMRTSVFFPRPPRSG